MSGVFANRMDRTLWRGGWREIGGYKKYYRSRWEANYARYLEHLKSQGVIDSWAHEPTTFWFEGIKRGVNNYLPDFQVNVIEDGQIKEEYHEVKGWMDAKSATKIKRMAKYHPDVKLLIIDRKLYTKLEREFCTVIEGWELLTDKEKDPETDSSETKTPPPKKKRGPTKLKKVEQQLLP